MYKNSTLAFLITLCSFYSTAQVAGPVKHIPPATPESKKSATGKVPKCYGDNIYNFEVVDGGYFGQVYSASEGRHIATNKLKYAHQSHQGFSSVNFFATKDTLNFIYQLWDKKSGKVTLYIQSCGALDLSCTSAPVELGHISFDPKTYTGQSANVVIRRSPDESKFLIYFDKIQLQGAQLVMCWVVGNTMELLWKGTYKIPTQSLGFNRELYFNDAGSVYLRVSGVMLTDDNVKTKADGTEKVKVKTSYWKDTSRSFFKLHGEEFRVWDGVLSPDIEAFGTQLGVGGDKAYIGVLTAPAGHERPQEWRVIELREDFTLGDERTMPVPREMQENLGLWMLEMNEDGSGYFIARKDDERTVVMAFDAQGNERWMNSIKWKHWRSEDVKPVAMNGRLYLFTNSFASQQAKPLPGEFHQTGGTNEIPVVFTFDQEGKLHIEDLVNKEQGGARFPTIPQFDVRQVKHCGYYVDRIHDKKKRGVVVVPLQ